jgi:hypothetical protein
LNAIDKKMLSFQQASLLNSPVSCIFDVEQIHLPKETQTADSPFGRLEILAAADDPDIPPPPILILLMIPPTLLGGLCMVLS